MSRWSRPATDGGVISPLTSGTKVALKQLEDVSSLPVFFSIGGGPLSLRRRVWVGFLLAIILSAVTSVRSQDHENPQYRIDRWTTDNGLPQNSVTSLTQTPDGYIWITTNDGLVRFDGVQFFVFNKSNTT